MDVLTVLTACECITRGMARRLQQIQGHLDEDNNDVVIVSGARSAFCRKRRGGLRDVSNDQIVSFLRSVVNKSSLPIDKELVSTFPECSLKGLATAYEMIKKGDVSSILVIGVETGKAKWSPSTSDYGISRLDADSFASRSHALAINATNSNKLTREIIPISVERIDPATKARRNVSCFRDDCIRANTSVKMLSKQSGLITSGNTGLITSGNSAQNADGGVGLLIMSSIEARRRHLPILATIVNVVERKDNVDAISSFKGHLFDFYEIHEDTAAHVLYTLGKSAIPLDKVNLKGGAIALGNPHSASGLRMVLTAIHEDLQNVLIVKDGVAIALTR